VRERRLDRARREAGVLLDAAEALLAGGEQHPPVLDGRGGRVLVERRDA
jgi:hypothetical protein